MYSIGGAFCFCLIIHLTEGKVYCQDTHASPWIPLGYTCPVMCENILNAIERLKIMDYRKNIEEQREKREKMNASSMQSLINISEETVTSTTRDEILKHRNKKKMKKHKEGNDQSLRNQDFDKRINNNQNKDKMEKTNDYIEDYIDNSIETGVETIDKIASKQNDALKEIKLNNLIVDLKMKVEIQQSLGNIEPKNENNLERELKNIFENRTCNWFRSKQPYIMIKKIIRTCGEGNRRNGYGEDLLRTLTRTMNRFSKASIEFTEDMAELVLRRVFGKKAKFGGEVFDVNKLLHYLRNAMEMHKQQRERTTRIVLKPRHCLTVSMPGCFCRPGFVESSGQCVKPADCVPDPSNEYYLSRIVVY